MPFGEEEGDCEYGAFAAPAEAQCSSLLLTLRRLICSLMRLVIFLNAKRQQIHRPLQILLLEAVSDADLVQPLAGRGVERPAGGEHDGIAMVVKLLQQPLLELLRVVDREGSHQVERALRAFADDARDLVQFAHDGIAAAMIFLAHGGEILRPDAVERRGGDLVERRDGEPRLTVFQCLRHKLHIPADEAADARAARGEPLRHGVNQDQIFIAIAKLQERQQLARLIGKLAVNLVGDEIEVMLDGHVEDHFHLLAREAGSGRVAGIGDHDGAGGRRVHVVDECVRSTGRKRYGYVSLSL